MGRCLQNFQNHWFWLKHLGVRFGDKVSGLGFESKGVRKGEGGLGLKPPLNLLCYKNVITYAKEFVYVFVHFLLV